MEENTYGPRKQATAIIRCVDLPWSDMELPDLVNGVAAEHDDAVKFLRPVGEKLKQRHRGITYDPRTIHCRRFAREIIIDENTIGQTFVINTSKGDIVVHSGTTEPPAKVMAGVEYFLDANSNVRTTDPHESGVMVGMGERVDYRSATITRFAPKKRKNISREQSDRVLLDVAVSARNYICNTPLKRYVEKDLAQLSKKNSAWIDNSVVKMLHPTYAASEDLTNSPHYDNDCGRCFAIFFRYAKHQGGTTCLVFPMIGLIIKCYRTAIISWVGNDMMHCSVSTNGGLRSLFMASNHRPVRYHLIRAGFLKTGRNKNLKKDMKVVVRCREDSQPCRRRKKQPFKYLNAVIISVCDSDEKNCAVIVRYECSKQEAKVSRDRACKTDWIQKAPSWRWN